MIKDIDSKDKEGKSNTAELVAAAILSLIVVGVVAGFRIYEDAYREGKCDAHHGILITMPNDNIECVDPNSIQKINISDD